MGCGRGRWGRGAAGMPARRTPGLPACRRRLRAAGGACGSGRGGAGMALPKRGRPAGARRGLSGTQENAAARAILPARGRSNPSCRSPCGRGLSSGASSGGGPASVFRQPWRGPLHGLRGRLEGGSVPEVSRPPDQGREAQGLPHRRQPARAQGRGGPCAARGSRRPHRAVPPAPTRPRAEPRRIPRRHAQGAAPQPAAGPGPSRAEEPDPESHAIGAAQPRPCPQPVPPSPGRPCSLMHS